MKTRKIILRGTQNLICVFVVILTLAFIACNTWFDPRLGSGGGGGTGHTHSYSDTWFFDATEHWKECTANDGAKTGVADHTGDPCTVCGYDSTATLVTFSSLTADGNATATTKTLTLTFSAAITGLSANDITLSGVAGVRKGALSGSRTSYTLAISGVTAGGTLTVAVAKTGYTISGSPKTVSIRYYSGGGGGGGGHTHSYAATWSFNATQHGHECTANDGAKTDEAAHTDGVCTVCGYDSSEPLVTFATNNPLTANGNTTTTTTTITFTLSEAIPGLSANDITLSGVTGVTKGTLSGSGPTYTLPISGFTSGGTLTITVAKSGYNISGSQTVTIYYVSIPEYSLGQTGPGGGIIFYYSAAGFTVQMVNSAQNYTAHYLEAAPVDIDDLKWASGSSPFPDITGTGTAIGTGRKNTALILATDATAPAAKACADLTTGGRNDWFLPSKDELYQLWVNRTSVGNMKTSTEYWTSSQYDNNNAYWQRFSSSNEQGYYSKTVTYPIWVRAVRAF